MEPLLIDYPRNEPIVCSILNSIRFLGVKRGRWEELTMKHTESD